MTHVFLLSNFKAMGPAGNNNKEWANGHIRLGIGIFMFQAEEREYPSDTTN